MNSYEDMETEKQIFSIMLDMGVPAHLKGYHFIRYGACMTVRDMKVVGSVTKLLYPEIAKRYNTTDGKVERAIRNAIEIAWERGNCRTFDRMFGYCPESGRCRPTNSEFIAAIADAAMLKRIKAAS